VGMGKDLAERFAAARDVFAAVDEALGFSLSGLAWNGPDADLTLTQNAQPAILAHTLAVHAVLRDVIHPVGAAGHSLGEYSAYVAAGSLAVAVAARLVRRRGELMSQAGEQRPGAMAAVLGLAGEAVGGAFHSPLMAPAAAGLAAELERVAFADPTFPIVANVSAAPVRNAETARRLLEAQVTSPVRWVEVMQAAESLAGADVTFLEVGPGNVLAGLLKRIAPQATVTSMATVGDIERFLEQPA
jgi:[acyl-carrier-protein] S-malonyltransferase